jgi:propionyl-CoA synthetase
VIGIKDDLKGEVPCFVVLQAGVNREPAEVEREIVTLVRDKIGPVAAFKIVRGEASAQDAVRQNLTWYDEENRRWRCLIMPATIDDPAVLSEIGAALQGRR